MKQVVKNIFAVLNKKEKQHFRQLAIADILINVLDIGFLVLLLLVISFYTKAIPAATASVFSLAIFNEQPLLLITLFVILFAAKNILGYYISKWQFDFAYNVASRLSRQNLLAYLNSSYYDYVTINTAVINRKISQQPIEFAHYLLNGIQQAFSQLILITISIIAVLCFNPVLFPLLVLVLVPPVIMVAYTVKRKMNHNRIQGKITSELSIQHLQEALAGFIESKLYGKNDFFTDRYSTSQSTLNKYLSERHAIQTMPSRLMEVFAVFGLFVLIIINHFTAQSSISIITIAAFVTAAYKIMPGIVKLINLSGQIKTYSYSADGLSVQQNNQQQHSNGSIEKISFENVQFGYDEKKIINDLSFQFNKNELIGISGLSGKGKTTVLHLLLGFLTPSKGIIRINDKITTDADRQSYWNKIAYIKQQPFLIHASIVQNISLQEKDHDKEKLEKAIQLSGLNDVIAALPAGIETIITENGKNFSGGQRQRIVFARALYKDADVLILDEPFNELDDVAEIEMIKHIRNLAGQGKIVILITHNKSLLSFCNKKISLDEQ